MNLFRIHIRPSGGTDDMFATFRHCLDNGILGVGWRVETLTTTDIWEEYEQKAVPEYGSLQALQQPLYIYNNVEPGDLIWTRDPDGQYYLARVTAGWNYWTTPEGQEKNIDIANVFRCDFCQVALDAVPGMVVSRFGLPGYSIQRIHDRSTRTYSQHLWNGCADRQIYEVDITDFPNIFAMLDPEETEDLVFLYLQSQGWYVVPNSRKGNTLRFEFMLTHSETGEKALTQVKTGERPLNVDCYANDPQRIFLFQSNENYEGQCADNVECISRCDLADFLRDQIRLFPESFRTKLNLVEGGQPLIRCPITASA